MNLLDVLEDLPMFNQIPDDEPLVIDIEPLPAELAARRGVDRIMRKIRGAA